MPQNDGHKTTTKHLECDGECDGRAAHDLAGENSVGRPVWACRHCDAHRVGFFVGVDEVAAVATDGGTNVGQTQDDPEIVLRNMDDQTTQSVIDDLTEVGIKREVIRVES